MARATTKSIPGISFIRTVGGIKEYRLNKNGLHILLARDTASPVAGCMVTYHVGSRNEAIGYTGATHLLEHLMFKGSEHFNPEEGTTVDVILESKGAMINATTWNDRTNYYEIVPKDVLPLAIAIEADRMRNARILEKDRVSEMPVVRNEFERGENLPMEAVEKQLWALSYQAHPYHHSTIGWRSDIEGVSIERLKQFYDDFYWPDNATVTIAGDFDERSTLELIKKEFGKHTRAPKPLPELYTEEPPQEGERRAVIKRATSPMLGIAHKIPHALHEDIPALLVLSDILAEGKTSRLHHAFLDTGLATQVMTYCYAFRDPSLIVSYITLAPTTTHAKAEQILKEAYARIAKEGVTAAELARTKRNIRTSLAARRDGVYAFLASLNEDIARGDWTLFVSLPEALMKVTASDIRRVARTYLVDDQSTVVSLINTAA